MSSNHRTPSFIAIVFSIVLLAPFGLVGVNAQAAKVPLTHEAMWLMKRVGAPVPSPDGKWVVFSLV